METRRSALTRDPRTQLRARPPQLFIFNCNGNLSLNQLRLPSLRGVPCIGACMRNVSRLLAFSAAVFAAVPLHAGSLLNYVGECVPFARAASGIQIYGDAWTWWGKAAGHYRRGELPRGGSVVGSKWIRDLADFYGLNLLLAETSATSGGLDSLLAPTGASTVSGGKM